MNPGVLIFYFFVSISAIYILLGAEFLFAVQVLVYAGGIMVLFLFVIMLVNLDEPRRFSGGRLRLGLSTALSLILFGMLARIFVRSAPSGAVPSGDLGGLGNIELVGTGLYRYYLLPFEAVSLLLLVAMIGAIVLARPRA